MLNSRGGDQALGARAEARSLPAGTGGEWEGHLLTNLGRVTRAAGGPLPRGLGHLGTRGQACPVT